jgi:hypothetical protein
MLTLALAEVFAFEEAMMKYDREVIEKTVPSDL